MLLLKHVLVVYPTDAEATTQLNGKFSTNGICVNLGVGLGNVIAMAEQIIVNDNSFEHVKAKVKESLERIEEKW